MNGNYPAGVSSGHSHFNPPDTEHNHKWEQDDDTYPVIKDGAAIFVEYCTHETVLNTEQGYRETIVTDSIPCEETKEARFEIEYIETTSGERVYPPNAEDQDSWNELDDSVEEAIIATERATMDEDEEVSIEFDPDPDCGHVTVKWGGNTIRYSPTTQE